MTNLFITLLFLCTAQLSAQSSVDDIDIDNNGLIDVNNLETLDAMRYQLDGSGLKMSPESIKITDGCPIDGCMGYELTSDLDFLKDASYNSTANKVRWTTGEGWQPIGTDDSSFVTTFEGNNFTISNLMINRPGSDHVALFGFIGGTAKIANIDLLNVNITGNNIVSGLAGVNDGNITNTTATGIVIGDRLVGGLVGHQNSDGSITTSYASGKVMGESDQEDDLATGGLVGRNDGRIMDSHAAANIISENSYAGGLVGFNKGSITHSYATGRVRGTDDVGGLVGHSIGGSITYSYATGRVRGTDDVGGLIGSIVSDGSVIGGYATGTVRGKSLVGGLVGVVASSANIENSFATGAVIGNTSVGGLAGQNEGNIMGSYASGVVEGVGRRGNIGGLVGSNQGRITNSYANGIVTGNLRVGGLVGQSKGSIMGSYASGAVAGDNWVGGLVGENSKDASITHSQAINAITGDDYVGGLVGKNLGRIMSSYASGAVAGNNQVGGLVGENSTGTSIANSYATGTVKGHLYIGGLVGQGIAEVTNSYWDITASRIETSNGGVGKTTQQLQSPTTATGIYSDWSTENWDFGTNWQYPVLKYARGDDENNPACRGAMMDMSSLPICGHLLLPITRYGLMDLQLVGGNLSPDFIATITHYTGTAVSDMPTVQLIPTAIKPNAKISITMDNTIIDKSIASGMMSSAISLDADGTTNIMLEVTNDGASTHTFEYTLNLKYYHYDGDVDKDNDGLIEISDLESLNAIRYQSDGSGYQASADTPKITIGCVADGCKGYELTRNLDFLEDASYISATNKMMWTTGLGWQPIANPRDGFATIFEGNSHTISNLMINRSSADYVGLFGYTIRRSKISNIGLLNVHITATDYVGGLVGESRTSITNSYVVGTVTGNANVGGLVGINTSVGSITNSYAFATIKGSIVVGGLVATNTGTIMNSYTSGVAGGNNRVGGLVGWNRNGSIINSYATSAVTGAANVGGLSGTNSGSITYSYWDTETSGVTLAGSGEGKTTSELQSPTMAVGIYSSWSDEIWDFRTDKEYPVVRYMRDDDGGNPACGPSQQDLCEPMILQHINAAPTIMISPLLLNVELLQGTSSTLMVTVGDVDGDRFNVSIGSSSERVATATLTILDRSNTFMITARLIITARETGDAVITIAAIDNQGASTNQNIEVRVLKDIDKDDDGLIEVNDLETLDAMRYQPDGSGLQLSATAEKTMLGCAVGGCKGYELTTHLDFLEDASYSSTVNQVMWTVENYEDSADRGWQPIGSFDNQFSAFFEGNNYTISNLMINRPDSNHIGLFRYTGSAAKITNVGLLNVHITGNYFVGGVVGENNGSVANSYVAGAVRGSNDRVGGLVGTNSGDITNSYAIATVSGSNNQVGGLVGHSSGEITNSYASSVVEGSGFVGGLVGASSGDITNSYARGAVAGDSSVGGLVGENDNAARITNSYAVSVVEGGSSVGGLVGQNRGSSGRITNSYWDITASGIETSDGGEAKTTSQLQAPTTATGIYGKWSTKNWDFGTNQQYPVLKYASGPDNNNPACQMPDGMLNLPICGHLLSPIIRYGLIDLQLAEGHLSPDFITAVMRYTGTVVSSVSRVQLIPTAVQPNATISITANDSKQSIASGTTSSVISLDKDGTTAITLEVINADIPPRTIEYILRLQYHHYDGGDIDKDNDGLIEINHLEDLNAIRYQPDGTGYRASDETPKITVGCAAGGCKGYELTRDLDFMEDASYSSIANKMVWTTGAGWQPIGNRSNSFAASFEGNDYTISNLMINRANTGYIGLFGRTSRGTKITNIGLLDITVTGDYFVGGLVGENDNSSVITNSYASGVVAGDRNVGGLVGKNNGGSIANSYAAGTVSGSNNQIGGLVGRHNGGSIANSYAINAVSGSSDVGGLVGQSGGSITNSYAIGAITGTDNMGGLVGQNEGTITDSYWDIETSGIASGNDGAGKITAELQSPTMAIGIYRSWSATVWDFGTTKQYPAIKYTRGDDDDNPACGSSQQPVCETSISGQRNTTPTIVISSTSLNIKLLQGASRILMVTVTDTNNDPLEIVRIVSSDEEVATATLTILDVSHTRAVTAQLILTAWAAGDAVITITVADNQGASASQNIAVHVLRDIDEDDDGLIEVSDLETLNAMRYQPDGSGLQLSATAEKTMLGCAVGGCKGYELTTNLDFLADASYSSTANQVMWTVENYEDSADRGWQPIGSLNNQFSAFFEGNNYTISNLMINRPDSNHIGLFGDTGNGTRITNISLFNVNIKGDDYVGGLVAKNEGSIINSYMTGMVEGSRNIGGLVGRHNGGSITNSYAIARIIGQSDYVGGLVGGNNEGSITNSYALGNVTGRSYHVGGLVGDNGGSITNSYATGAVEGNGSVGGLVGTSRGLIMNSYAIGAVEGTAEIGGLVGDNNGSITHSYWDTDTSGITTGSNGEGKTKAELQSPTTPTQIIYVGWSTADWDFGSATQYPILKYAPGRDKNNPACQAPDGILGLPICGHPLSPALRYGLIDLQLTRGYLSPDFVASIEHYTGVVSGIDTIQLIPTAVNPNADIAVTANGSREILASGAASTAILLNRDGTTDIILKVINDGATAPTIEYTVRLRYRHDATDIERVGEPAEQIVVNIRALLEGRLPQK